MQNTSVHRIASSPTSSTAWSVDFYNMFYMYAFSVLAFMALFNNVVILIVAHGFEDFKKAVPVHVRIYYLCFAYADIGNLLPYYIKFYIRMYTT